MCNRSSLIFIDRMGFSTFSHMQKMNNFISLLCGKKDNSNVNLLRKWLKDTMN